MSGTNTQTLTGIFDDVADAIRAKDGTSAQIYPDDFATKIAAIPSGGGGGFDYTGLSGVKFAYNTDTSINLSTLDTSSFTSFDYMFYYCSNLASINTSQINSSHATSMTFMFAGCSSLTSLDLSPLDTSNVTNMSSMLRGLTVASLDLKPIDWSSVDNISYIFYGNTTTSLNLQSIDTTNITNMTAMFTNCNNLTAVIWGIDSTSVVPLKASGSTCGINNSSLKTSGNGYFYVRDSLLSSYQSDTNFSYIATKIKSINDLPAALQTLYNIDPRDYQ